MGRSLECQYYQVSRTAVYSDVPRTVLVACRVVLFLASLNARRRSLSPETKRGGLLLCLVRGTRLDMVVTEGASPWRVEGDVTGAARASYHPTCTSSQVQ